MLLTDAEVRQERMDALARVFQQADRVLTGERVWCHTTDDPAIPAPGWSDGENIVFNMAYIGSVASTDDIIKVTGLNYHELSHIMFTPRAKSAVGQAVKKENLLNAFNILEDQRIETLLTGWYPSTEPYFLMIIMQYILDKPDKWENNYLLCAGRRYMPGDVVAELRARYKHQEDLADIDRIIDEYRLLAYGTKKNDKRGLELIREFHALLEKHIDTTSVDDPYGHSTGSRPEVAHGVPFDSDDQGDAAECAEIADADEEASEGKGKGKGKGTGRGKSNADADGDGDGDEGSGGLEAGSGGGPAIVKTDANFRAKVKKALEATKQSAAVQKDAQEKQRTVVDDLNRDGAVPKVDREVLHKTTVDLQTLNASRDAATELQQVRADIDPGWRTYRNSGRLNVGRVMQGVDFDEAFDQWDPGVNDATDFEWVICVDLSGSMSTRVYDVSMALWAVKRAIEEIGGSVTVFGFNNDAILLYDRSDKADANQASVFRSSGGTVARSACNAARTVFYHSVRRHKVFAIFSDGQWYDSEPAERSIKMMNDNGILTVSGFFIDGRYNNDGYFQQSKHECQVHARIDDVSQVVTLCRDVARSLMH